MEADRGRPIRVLIVAEDALVRAALVDALEGQPAVEVVQAIGSGPENEWMMGERRVEVVLWDLGWGQADDLEALAETAARGGTVVALASSQIDAGSLWRSGVRGVVSREAEGAKLAAALVAAARGLLVAEPETMPGRPYAEGSAPFGEREALTARERQVLELLAQGLPNKSIAHRLGISENTAKFHVNAILRKLGAQSRTEAVVLATRQGLLLL